MEALLDVSLVILATQYADGVIEALATVESEQELREGMAGAFLSFAEAALKEGLCQHRIGMHAN
jgi:hypothetical protein